MSEDTDVMFRIGVMDHPESRTALQGLAAAVETAQARMDAGVAGIGQTASRVSGLVDSLASSLDRLSSSSSAMRSAPNSVQPMGAGVRGGVPDSVVAQVASFDASITKVQDKMSSLDTSGLSKSVQGFFAEIQNLSAQTGETITQQWEQNLSGIVTSFSTSMEQLSQRSTETLRSRSAMPDNVQPMGAASVPDAVVEQAKNAEAAIDSMQAKVNGFDVSGLSKSMRNVFSQLEVDSSSSVDEIVSQLETSVASLATSATAQATIAREAYAAAMVEHSEAYASMAKDLDGYLAKNGSTMDRIAANLRIGETHLERYRSAADKATADAGKKFVEAGLNVAQVAKGMATIGLVSEENAEKFLRSIAVIQGTFDVVKGGIKAYSDLSDGLKKAREAQQLLSKAQTTQAALETAQLARLKAYHAALIQEAAAANTAAAANGRLAASRVAAGAAAGAGGAAGTAGNILSSMGGMGGMGRMASLASRATPIGLGIAAAAAGGAAIYQHQTGSATTSDSSVQGSVVRFGTYLLRLTGQFEKLDSPMNRLGQSIRGFTSQLEELTGLGAYARIPVISDISSLIGLGELAASQAGAERAEASLSRNRINNDADRAMLMANRQSQFESERLRFSNFTDFTRTRADAETQRFGFRDNAGDRQFELKAMKDRMRLRSVTDEGVLGSATVGQLAANSMRMRSQPSAADTQLSGEMEIYTQAASQYARAKSELDRTLAFAGSSDAERAQALKEAQAYSQDMTKSLERQAQLARQSGANRLAIEREIQQTAMSAIEQQSAKLDALDNRRKSAMKSFVGMDALDRDMAIKALEKARAGGGASLSQMESDLLGRIGTDETSRFVDESTEAQAKKFGFDATFGASINDTRKQIEGTRQQLEAQLQASFDVSMKVEADTDRVVDAILPQVERAISDMTAAIERSLEEKLRDQRAEINTQRGKDLAALKNGR